MSRETYKPGLRETQPGSKRRYGLKRSRLKGHHGARTWTGWGILTYNLDTLTVQTP